MKVIGNFYGRYNSLDEVKDFDPYPKNNSVRNDKTHKHSWDSILLSELKNFGDKKIKLLELGCTSSCRIYHLIKNVVNLEKYFGLDLKLAVDNSDIKNNTDVLLSDNIDSFTETVDVFYSDSSLQYIMDTEEFLFKVIQLNPKVIIINRTPFTNNDKFITLQLFENCRIPYRVSNENGLIEFLKNNNYHLKHSSKYSDLNLNGCNVKNHVFIYEDN